MTFGWAIAPKVYLHGGDGAVQLLRVLVAVQGPTGSLPGRVNDVTSQRGGPRQACHAAFGLLGRDSMVSMVRQ